MIPPNYEFTEKTIHEWFNELPAAVQRRRAVENAKRQDPRCLKWNARTLFEALDKGFTWEDTPQGYYYWFQIHSKHLYRELGDQMTFEEFVNSDPSPIDASALGEEEGDH